MPLAGRVVPNDELASLCYKHGLRGEGIVIALAVCQFESSRFEKAWNFNDKTGDKSYGLWQINMKGPLSAERIRKYSLKAETDLYQAEVNARIMADISKKGTDFRQWGAFTNGNYRKALPTARLAAAKLPFPYPAPKFPTGLRPGAKLPSARPLQRALKKLGYLPANFVEKDLYDGPTQTAVSSFYKAHKAQGFIVTPGIGPKGWMTLWTEAHNK